MTDLIICAKKRFPVGAAVRYYPVPGSSTFDDCVVTSEPWVLDHGAIVVTVSGREGPAPVVRLRLPGEQAPASRSEERSRDHERQRIAAAMELEASNLAEGKVADILREYAALVRANLLAHLADKEASDPKRGD